MLDPSRKGASPDSQRELTGLSAACFSPPRLPLWFGPGVATTAPRNRPAEDQRRPVHRHFAMGQTDPQATINSALARRLARGFALPCRWSSRSVTPGELPPRPSQAHWRGSSAIGTYYGAATLNLSNIPAG
jgi:hypothetical protein